MKSMEYHLTLDDICFKPTGNACVVQTVSEWFNAGLDEDTWRDRIEQCAAAPGDQQCLPSFQDPLQPGRILGGYGDNVKNVTDAKAMIVTWVVNNHPQGSEGEARAEDWRKR